MKSRLLFAILFDFVLSSNFLFCQDDWEPVGPSGKDIFNLTEKSNILFASSYGYVYRSDSNGDSWEEKELSGNSNQVYCTLAGDAIVSFELINSYISVDDGNSFNFSNRMDASIWCGTIVKSQTGYIYFAGGHNGKLFISEDALNWSIFDDFGKACEVIYVKNDNFIVGGSGYLKKYNFNTSNFENINVGLSSSLDPYTLIEKNNKFFLGTDDGIFVSSNNGKSWTQRINGLKINIDTKFTSSASDSNRVYFGIRGPDSFGGVCYTNDNGLSYNYFNEGLPTDIDVNTLLVHNNYLFLGSYNYGVYRRKLSSLTSNTDFKSESNSHTIKTILIGNNNFNILQEVYVSEITVYNYIGQIVYSSYTNNKFGYDLNITKLSPGIYYFKYKNEEGKVFINSFIKM